MDKLYMIQKRESPYGTSYRVIFLVPGLRRYRRSGFEFPNDARQYAQKVVENRDKENE